MHDVFLMLILFYFFLWCFQLHQKLDDHQRQIDHVYSEVVECFARQWQLQNKVGDLLEMCIPRG